ncbi:MAG: FAD/NAD(P)-binding protein, partial [Pseudomonadota bacterium]
MNDHNGKTHLVVGDGITALAFIEASPLHRGDRLVVLGRNVSSLGRGVAYAKGAPDVPWRFAYLLNSPADDIDPAFAIWLDARWDSIRDTMAGRAPNWLGAAQPLVEGGDIYGLNAPREFYGDFIEEKVNASLAALRARGVEVRLVEDGASAIAQQGPMIAVQTDRGETLIADSVDIAPGGPSTLRIPGDDGPLSAPSLFGHETRIAEHIKAGAEIFCVGGNASMLDALRLCQSLVPEADLRFVACAPDGQVPPALVPRLPRKMTEPKLTEGHATAESFLTEVRQAIEAARAEGDETREIRAGFRAHFLNRGLHYYIPDPSQARLVPRTLRFWLRGGTRDTIIDMHRLIEAGKVKMLTGSVAGIEHGADGVDVFIEDAGHNT